MPMYLVIFLAFSLHGLPYTSTSPPDYIPATIGINNVNRDWLIERYFHLGLNYIEIVNFLLSYHGIRISLRQLKRIIKVMGLKRRKESSSLNVIVDAVEREISGSGNALGYRLVHQRLCNNHGLIVDRETVRHIIKGLDPEGVSCRKRKQFRRRQYSAKGPNMIWHIDGYDKLKPFGFCIHGAIDGYSRKILWLEVGPSNNNPRVIAHYFLDCVRLINGCPRVIRADNGTENGYVASTQRFFRRDCNDGLAGPKSFIYGKSTSNQRIEAWWSFLRKANSHWWISFFKDLRDTGLYNDSDVIQVECLKYCFMPIIQLELDNVVKTWNLHRIRKTKNSETPPGRPDVLYYLPEANNTRDYKTTVTDNDIDLADTICGECRPPFGCKPSFLELATMIMADEKLSMPKSVEDARYLYLAILAHIRNI